jgi:hypothetical protein
MSSGPRNRGGDGMTIDEMKQAFENADEVNLKFEALEHRPSAYRDVCAFLLLEKLVTETRPYKFIAHAEHDVVYLCTDCAKLAEVITQDDAIYLNACGVRYDDGEDSLMMFV